MVAQVSENKKSNQFILIKLKLLVAVVVEELEHGVCHLGLGSFELVD